jgi:ribosomal protein S27E
VHSHHERRYICHACGKTFAETTGTMLYGLKYPSWLVILVVTLLAYGCPIQAIVAAFAVDARTVSDWQLKAGHHAQRVHSHLIGNGQVDVGQVQADELYTRSQVGPIWIATAMSVFSRLWLGGSISWWRDDRLITRVMQMVRAAAQPGGAVLIAVDGFRAYVTAVRKVFRDPVHTGNRGRPRLKLWTKLHLVQVVKQRVGARVVHVSGHLVVGCLRCAQEIIQRTQVDLGQVNTAYIERLNATLRTWMPALVRRTRTPAHDRERLEAALFWTGCVYNFCHVHATLQGTPAMAADVTDHVWSIAELLCYRLKRE